MSDLSVFAFESSAVRSLMVDGNPWFVAADIISALGLDRKALERIDEDEKGVNSIHTPGGDQEMVVLNESGLYSMILGSRKPEAKKFKKWVTSEVLPAIRKHGAFVADLQKNQDNATLDRLSSPSLLIPGHEADKIVASDRVFRAALRSARAIGMPAYEAHDAARKLAAKTTGVDLAGAISRIQAENRPKPMGIGLDMYMAEWVAGQRPVEWSMETDWWAVFSDYGVWAAQAKYARANEETFRERLWRELWPLRKQEIERRKAHKT